MDPSTCQGQSFVGKIKSYSSVNGYGFIVSEQIAGDLFFFHKNLPKDVTNRAQWGLKLEEKDVSFTCENTPEGKAGAIDIQILEELSHVPEKGSKGKGKKGSWWDDWYGGWGYGWGFGGYGKMGFGIMKGAKGKGKGKKGMLNEHQQPGTPMLDERIEAQMKSYSNGSKWGFATADASAGDVGDIFVHMNNMDPGHPSEVALREGDVIELNLEELNGKPVAKKVTIVPQEASVYVSQFVKGKVISFDEGSGMGAIAAPRISGELPFSKDDCAASMEGFYVDADVMFRIIIGVDGKAKASLVNPLWGMEYSEGMARATEVIETLNADGYIDDTAVKALSATDPNELLTILPDLDLIKADNPSSFILGALSRQRFAEMAAFWGGWGWGWGKGKGKKGYGPY